MWSMTAQVPRHSRARSTLRRSGTFCWYGPVLGGPGPIDIMKLPKSIKIGYATFFDHIHTPELLRSRSARLFDWITERKLKIRIKPIPACRHEPASRPTPFRAIGFNSNRFLFGTCKRRTDAEEEIWSRSFR